MLHGDVLAVEDVVFERREAVGAGRGRDSHDVSRIVTRASVVVVPSVGNAVIHQQGEERGRHVVRV